MTALHISVASALKEVGHSVKNHECSIFINIFLNFTKVENNVRIYTEQDVIGT